MSEIDKFMVEAIQTHIREEQDSILAYERVGRAFDDPVIAAIIQLILDDEARHHAALERIAAIVTSTLNWSTPPEPQASAAINVNEAIRELRALADEERRGVTDLRGLARRSRDGNDDLCAVLLESMAMDSDKHARQLELVIQRLAARAQRVGSLAR
jgi:rubrerythrin